MISRINTRWTKRKQRSELEHYLAHLVELNDLEMSLVVMVAALARNEMERNAVGLGFAAGSSLLQPYEFVAFEPDQGRRFEAMCKEVYGMPQQVFATGLTPWLHTVRAVENPPLTVTVKVMWQEISRGFDLVPDLTYEVPVAPANVEGFSTIPDGFQYCGVLGGVSRLRRPRSAFAQGRILCTNHSFRQGESYDQA